MVPGATSGPGWGFSEFGVFGVGAFVVNDVVLNDLSGADDMVNDRTRGFLHRGESRMRMDLGKCGRWERRGSSGTRALLSVAALALLGAAGVFAFKNAWSSAGNATMPTALASETSGSAGSTTNTPGEVNSAGKSGSSATAASANQRRRAAPAAIEAIVMSAKTYVQQGENAKAETVLAEAVSQYAEEQPLRLAYADALLTQKKINEAYDQYIAALTIGPRTAKIEGTAGTIASLAGKSDRAIEHYQAAQTAEPTNAEYPLFLGQIQLKAGEMEAGKASLIRAARLDPNSATAWGSLADVAMRQNSLSVALQHIAKARKLDPTSVAWRLIECRALARSGEPGKGVELLITLDDSLRFQTPVLKQIAECYGLMSKPGDAALIFGKASDSNPADASLAMQAAEWFENAKQSESALAYGLRALDLGQAGALELVTRVQAEK